MLLVVLLFVFQQLVLSRTGNNFLVSSRTGDNFFGLGQLTGEGKGARESWCFFFCCFFALLVLLLLRIFLESFFGEPVPVPLFLLVVDIDHFGVIYYCLLSFSGVNYLPLIWLEEQN